MSIITFYLVKEVTEAQAGDVILFGTRDGDKHCAYHAGIIYSNEAGKLKVIHCISQGVDITADYEQYWKERTMLPT